MKKQLAAGKLNLDDPATTIALLKLNAVVGVTVFTNPDGSVAFSAHFVIRQLTILWRQASVSASMAGPIAI